MARFEIHVRVIDDGSGTPAEGLVVEAWDKDALYDDLVGREVTDSDGRLVMVFDESYFEELFFDSRPDLFFVVYQDETLLLSTESSVLWNVSSGSTTVELHLTLPAPVEVERDIYLRIEPVEHYNPVNPTDHVPAGVQYKRDCMQHHGHHNGVIPEAEVHARAVDAIIYREYLDPDYLVPKIDKIVQADVNEPSFEHRVPGTVIYAHPGQLLRIHVHNADTAPHSLHMHGLLYGIDSDGSWPFGTQNASGRRSDEICPGQSWTYTFRVTEQTMGVWPFHDHAQHDIDESINRGLFGGVVVLPKGKAVPRRPKFRPVDDLLDFVRGFAKPGRRVQPPNKIAVQRQIEWIKERWQLEIVKPPARYQKILHVPLFYHVMSDSEQEAVFDTGPIAPGSNASATFAEEGELEYFCQVHPAMTGTVRVEAGGPPSATVNIVPGPPRAFSPSLVVVGVGGSVTWVNGTGEFHTATSVEGASLPTHCFNGRGFIGNSPTIVGWAGQKIRWYIFNLDLGTEWHNFHPHSSRWRLGAETIDVRGVSPAESFFVETEVPSPLLMTDAIREIQNPKRRPKDAELYQLKGEFLVHCHVHHHMMNGMAGLIRAKQRVWLTPAMVAEIEATSGLPLDDGGNGCPAVDHHRCEKMSVAKVEKVPGDPEVIMMHAALLPLSETVLIWGKTSVNQSRLWNSATGVFSMPGNQPAALPGETDSTSDLWSAAHAFLADGRLLAHGGLTQGATGLPTKSFLFDASNVAAPWSQTAETERDRFYASTITLPDGRLLTMHGNDGGMTLANSIEVYDPALGTWSAPKLLPPGFLYLYYPWLYLLPDGELFIAGPQELTRKFDWTATPIVDDPAKQWTTGVGDRGDNMNGTSVLLTLRPPDYAPIVLIMGGAPSAAQQSTEIMDLSAPTPGWVAGPNLNEGRINCTSVLLPNGHVFIAGGMSGGGPVETLDSRDMSAGWQSGPVLAYDRLYHSSMILLPDGSVLIGGDDDGADPCERYFPAYYSRPRPAITSSPASAGYGATFSVDTPQASSIAEVVIMRAGAVTHGFDMSQRAIELTISSHGPGSIDVVAPPDANVAPPGFYLLFLLDDDRVPSKASWIQIGP